MVFRFGAILSFHNQIKFQQMNKLIILLIGCILVSVQSQQCRCDQLELIECRHEHFTDCYVENGQCVDRLCKHFGEDHCNYAENYDGERQYCYWDGEACKDNNGCARTYVDELTALENCSGNCKIDPGNAKKCIDVAACSEITSEPHCDTLIGDKQCWWGSGSCQEASQCSDITSPDGCSQKKIGGKFCWWSGSCLEAATCAGITDQGQCYVFWQDCQVKGDGTCTEKGEAEVIVCANVANNICDFQYFIGKEGKRCMLLSGVCTEIDLNYKCSILDKSKCEDNEPKCFWDLENSKCRDATCKEINCDQATAYIKQGSTSGDFSFCKKDRIKDECAEGKPIDLLDNCNERTGNLYAWRDNDCQKCSELDIEPEEDIDDSAYVLSFALLMSIFLVF